MTDRVAQVHENFLRRVAEEDFPLGEPPDDSLAHDQAIAIFRAGCLSRALDRASRAMQAAGQGFYTIGSSGHEGLAAVAAALRVSDMAFLHYRDGAFLIQRAMQAQEQGQKETQSKADRKPQKHDSIIWDMLLSFACSSEDPISGGRHKVLGSKALNIPPQTSTIASHLPKAVGAAYSIHAARLHRPEHAHLPDDSIIFCSFGDASANHSTALGAFNAAQWTSYQSIPLPILFCCEDNGIGISTKTPKNWISSNFANRAGLRYFYCDGLDIYQSYRVASEAALYVRQTRKPAFLHIRTIRLYGHAGADVATSYLPLAEIESEEAQDPLLHSVRLLAEAQALSPQAALDLYTDSQAQTAAMAKQAGQRPHLTSAQEVMKSILPRPRLCKVRNAPAPAHRAQIFGAEHQLMNSPQVMSRLLNWALSDLMMSYPEVVLMGEDIGRKGGVYGVTQKLQARFGSGRVIDTILDEQSILGLALGMAHNGFVPIPEIQFLAYLHNAEDQIRGEAATLSFFSNRQFSNPMVVRVAGLAYQKGFGGHFHNDNALAVLRDIPGVILAVPSDGAEAAQMLRESVRLAREEQRVVVFVEPIALYAMRDLHREQDGRWLRLYPDLSERVAFGSVGIEGSGRDLAIVSFGNGIYLAQQARRQIEAMGIGLRIIDLRWLSPLPFDALDEAVADCRAILIVDETRRSGGVAEALMTHFAETRASECARICRLTAEDSFISTGKAYATTLPSTEAIVKTARELTTHR